MANDAVVSVIVPVRDGAAMLVSCLDALAGQTGLSPSEIEVLVVDNGSGDASPTIAAAHPAVSRVLHEARAGSYAARNAGVAAASAPSLAFTDADCTPRADWLAGGLAALGAGADLAGGAVEPAERTRPTPWERYDRAVYLRQDELITHDGFAATANLFVRRAVFDAVGPFDPRLRSGGDYEFGRRATAAGFRLVHAPDAVVVHRPRAGLSDTWRLHRRIGAGWADLHAAGKRGRAVDDPALRLAVGTVIERAAAGGDPLRRRHIAHVHAVVMVARWTGRLTRR